MAFSDKENIHKGTEIIGKFSDYFRRKADGEQADNAYGEEYGYYEDEHGDAYTSRLRYYAPRNSQQASAPTQSATDTANAMKNFMVYEPRNADDVQTLIDFLKRKESAIINLDNIEPEISQRVLDFVSGAIYALNGSVHRISGNIFLLSPEGVRLAGTFENGDNQ